jgi:hypothetical protein
MEGEESKASVSEILNQQIAPSMGDNIQLRRPNREAVIPSSYLGSFGMGPEARLESVRPLTGHFVRYRPDRERPVMN